MFDLEAALAAWRRQAQARDPFDEAMLAELEDHLRQEFAAQSANGQPATEAWETAVGKLGEVTALSCEYVKITQLATGDRTVFGALAVGAASAVGLLAVAIIWRGDRLLAQPLLGLHVLTLTLGYVATVFVAGAAGYGALRRMLAPRPSVAVDAAAFRWIRWGGAAATVATLAGFVLGALWADSERGSLFAGDPREVGGLMALLMLIATTWIAWRWSDPAATRCATALAIVAGGVVLAAWFGVASLQPVHGFHNGVLPLVGFGGLTISVLLAALSLRQESARVKRT